MLPGRHLLAVLLAVALGVGGGITVLSLPPARASAAGPVQRAAAPVGSCARPAPQSAAGYQAMFDGKDDETWAGGDQAASVALPGGRILWMFGDSVRGERLTTGARAPGSRFVHNAMLVQTGGCLVAVPAADEVIPSRADGQWYWPQSAVVLGDRLVVFCARVRRTGPGPFGFRTTGVDAAVFALDGSLPRFERVVGTPSSLSPESAYQYGAAVVPIGSWLYLYGSRQVRGAFGRAVAVARVRPAALLRSAGWQYWDGSRWSSRAAAAAHLVAGATDGWSSAFSVWRGPDGTLRSLTKEHDVFGRAVVTGRASSPTRPFTRRVAFDAPSGQRPGELRYNALAHPEVRLPGGLLLVTVCRNNRDLRLVWADTRLYRPQFAAVRA
jgi:hypothetical protein